MFCKLQPKECTQLITNFLRKKNTKWRYYRSKSFVRHLHSTKIFYYWKPELNKKMKDYRWMVQCHHYCEFYFWKYMTTSFHFTLASIINTIRARLLESFRLTLSAKDIIFHNLVSPFLNTFGHHIKFMAAINNYYAHMIPTCIRFQQVVCYMTAVGKPKQCHNTFCIYSS